MNRNRGFKLGYLSIFLISILFIFSSCTINNNDVDPGGCILDVKICSDGTPVSRIGPSCSFAACPDVAVNNDLKVNDDSLKKFSSKEDFIKYLSLEKKENFGINIKTDNILKRTSTFRSTSIDFINEDSGFADVSDEVASDFSETNVQVKGVDEADIVKNDGKYIYTLSQNKLIVVDAFPAESSKILSKLEFTGNAKELFIRDNNLVVFLDYYFLKKTVSDYSFIPNEVRVKNTKILVYDLTNKEDLKLIRNYSISGNYFDARLIDNDVYIITKEDLSYIFNSDWDFPVIRSGLDFVFEPEVFYFGNPEDSYNMHTVASFNLDNFGDGSDKVGEINAKTFMLGNSNTFYVSKNNIYVAYQKNMPYWFYEAENMNAFFKVVVPLFNVKYQKSFEGFEYKKFGSQSDLKKAVVVLLEEMYSELSKEEEEKLVLEIRETLEIYNEKKAIERDRTIIHKISIDEGEIDYVSKGEIQGHLLNQFSLDEASNGDLRLASTTNVWSNGRISFSNVVILDSNMKKIGEITDIAKGEKIYSTRFIGDKLYMVTFEQIDPLFVIDLSDSKNPSILGKLKIPGFSNYLHPYDEDHLIGIGKDTKLNDWGGVVTNGVKLSLFDISDFENPKEVDNYVIKGKWTDSIALKEHKAFLFNKKKNILVMPIRVYKGETEDKYGYNNHNYYFGAYVFEFNSDLNFVLKGKISHDDNEKGYNYWYNSPSAVKRSLYMDDVLYTISDKKIVANDLSSDNLDEIKTINLGSDSNYNYYYY